MNPAPFPSTVTLYGGPRDGGSMNAFPDDYVIKTYIVVNADQSPDDHKRVETHFYVRTDRLDRHGFVIFQHQPTYHFVHCK
jgi:hypothetical protein